MNKKKDWMLILTNDKNRALALSLIRCLEQKKIPFKETSEGIEIEKKYIDKLMMNYLNKKN